MVRIVIDVLPNMNIIGKIKLVLVTVIDTKVVIIETIQVVHLLVVSLQQVMIRVMVIVTEIRICIVVH